MKNTGIVLELQSAAFRQPCMRSLLQLPDRGLKYRRSILGAVGGIAMFGGRVSCA